MPDVNLVHLEDGANANPTVVEDDFLNPPDPSAQDGGVDLKKLQETLDRLEEANKGLIKDLQKERGKRQQTQGRLEQVTETVNSILEAREQLLSGAQGSVENAEKVLNGIPVEFTESGEAFVPAEKLAAFTSRYEDEIAALKEQLANTSTAVQANTEYQQIIDGIVGEKDEYAPAYRRYKAARKWANDKVIEFTTDNNIQGSLNSGQALDFVFSNPSLAKEFEATFPGMDLPSVVTAEDSRWHLKRVLESIVEANEKTAVPVRDSRFQRVINKPSTFGRSADAKGGQLSITEKVGNLSATDIMNLSDAQIEALEKYMKQEEKDGIIW